MSNNEFEAKAKIAIVDYFNKHRDITDGVTIGVNDVYIVWLCKTLQNHKALLSTTISDGMYYEFTWNGDNNEGYLDVYKKWENVLVK